MNNTDLLIQQTVLKYMKTQDINSIKVSLISKDLKISRSTFYQYYDSVFSVLQKIEDDFFIKLENIAVMFWHYPLNKRYLTEPHPINLKVLCFLKNHQELFSILFGPYGDFMFQIRVQNMIQCHLLPPRILEQLYPKHTELVASYKIGGHLRQISYWLNNLELATTEEMAIITYQDMFGDVLK